MSKFSQLAKMLGLSEKATFDIIKKTNSLDDIGELSGRSFSKGSEKGMYDLSQHTPEMMSDVVTNPNAQTLDNPFYLSEIQAVKNKLGLGQRLLNESMYDAQKQGADGVYLQADASITPKYNQTPITQAELESMYKKSGFEIPNETANLGATPMIRDFAKNPPLDMSREARLQRALDQGYSSSDGKLLVNSKTGNKRLPSASFDPKKIDSKKLLASTTGATLAGALLGGESAEAALNSTSKEKSKINEFLKGLGGYVPPTTQEEYATEDSSIRNYLANKINPALDASINKVIPEDMGRVNIPVLSRGEQKDQDREMLKPENMAMSLMPGSIGKAPSMPYGNIMDSIKGKSKEAAANAVEELQGAGKFDDLEFDKLTNLRRYLRGQANAEKALEPVRKNTGKNLENFITAKKYEAQKMQSDMANQSKLKMLADEVESVRSANPEDATGIINLKKKPTQ